MPIRVLLVDDHRVFADTMQERLSAEADFDPVLVAYSMAEARARIGHTPVDVMVVDHMLGDGAGTELVAHARETAPATAVIILSAVRDIDPVVDAVLAGARGWVPKSLDVAYLVQAIHGVHHGEMWLSPSLLGGVMPKLLQRLGHGTPDPLAVLTSREREVLDCMVGGMTRAEIGVHLQLSLNTVRTHTQNLINKLGVHSSVAAVAIALRSQNP